MLSIIVCITEDRLIEQLKKSMRDTISSPYELLVYDNHPARLSLAAAYNTMAEKAAYSYLLFLHQDVIFHEKGWDTKIIDLLGEPSIGLVGLSGSIYKSHYPGSWSMTLEEFYRRSLASESECEEVVVIDGFFMAVRKEVWKLNSFNESELTGFHYYDYDYSLELSKKYKIVVAGGIRAEHLSDGKFDSAWITASIGWHQRQRNLLPAGLNGIPRRMKRHADYRSCSGFAGSCIQNKQKPGLILKYMIKCYMIRPFARFNLSLLSMYFKKLKNPGK